MTIYISHTHGITETHYTMAEAWAALKTVYGEDIYGVAADGWEIDENSDGVRGGLVWSDEADSESDPGVRAVASISGRSEYPALPPGRTEESAYYCLDGPPEQVVQHLRTLIDECEDHANGAPEDWDASDCIALSAEAEDLLKNY